VELLASQEGLCSMELLHQTLSQSVSQPGGHTVSQSVSWSDILSVRQIVGQIFGYSVSQIIGQLGRQAVSQLSSLSVSQSVSRSVNQSVGQSVRQAGSGWERLIDTEIGVKISFRVTSIIIEVALNEISKDYNLYL
jgi:hypothetical protein